MVIKTIGIIGGKGLMGSFFAGFFRQNGFKVLISDINTKLTNKELTHKSDLIIISVPISVTKKVINEITPFINKNQLLTDVTSLKVFPIKEMIKSKAKVIGLHPMFRPGENGLKGQKIIMCAVRASAKQKIFLKNLFKKAEAKTIEMSPEKHDKLMAIIQVLIHFHTIVLGNTLRNLNVNIKETLQAMSPIYRLEFDVISRIFAQNAELYANILMLNPSTPHVIKSFCDTTKKMAEITAKNNTRQFINEFSKTSVFLGDCSKKALKESEKILQFFKKPL